MDIADILVPDGVVLRGAVSSKRQALGCVAEVAAQTLNLDSAKVLEALLEREALGSTGLGYGVAIPHARVEGVEQVCGVFVRLEAPVAYQALDDRPVDLLFALLAPPSAGAEHLRALAVVSRAMRSPELRERLRQIQTVDGARALFVQTGSAAAA